MITGVVTDPLGNVVYNLTFSGFEFFLGAVLGGITALVVWTTLKSMGRV